MTRKILVLICLTCALTFATIGVCLAESPATQPASAGLGLLGPRFTSDVYGLSFLPPANCTPVRNSTPDTIVVMERADLNWHLKAWQSRFPKSVPITTRKGQLGPDQIGVVEQQLDQIQHQIPNVTVVRNEIISVGRVRVGLIAVRYETATKERRFTQQAIIEAPDTQSQQYYFIDLTGPGKPATEPDDIDNPGEMLAQKTFSSLVDSIQVISLATIAKEQNERLYASRTQFANWISNKGLPVKSVLIPEQFQRVVLDGKDVGWNYIFEQIDPKKPKAPEDEVIIRIAIRSLKVLSPDERWDTQSVLLSTIDRSHETWWIKGIRSDHTGKPVEAYTQAGASNMVTKPISMHSVIGANGELGNHDGKSGTGPIGQGDVAVRYIRNVNVEIHHNDIDASFNEDVPDWYLPQAFSYLLPNLLPLDKPRGYMFATYTNLSGSQVGNVMERYLDVLPARTMQFNGREYQAIEIQDKLGRQGDVTSNFFDAQGRFIGSSSAYDNGKKHGTMLVIPSDIDTLNKLWVNPNLTAPVIPDAGVPKPAQ